MGEGLSRVRRTVRHRRCWQCAGGQRLVWDVQSGQWVRLAVPAAQVGLENVAVKGMAFTLYGGKAWWDKAGVANHTKYDYLNGQRHPGGSRMRKAGVVTYLHTVHAVGAKRHHLGSTVLETNATGAFTADQQYRAGVYPELAEGASSATRARW